MNIQKVSLALILLLSSTNSLAFFCPKNFNQINLGDSMEKIKELCGKPEKITKTGAPENVPQQWAYFIPQTVAANSSQQEQGTLKTSFTFNKEGKAINISVNGIGVGASSICGKNVSLGDTRKQIEAACGKPSFINKQDQGNKAPPVKGAPKKEDDKDKVISYTYDSTPPVTLIFENGKLTKKK